MNVWERMLRMLRIHDVPLPDLDQPNVELDEARQEVEQLHLKAEKVLDDYALANGQRRRRGK